MTRDDGTRRTRAMAKACEGISTAALEAGAVARLVGDAVLARDALQNLAVILNERDPSVQESGISKLASVLSHRLAWPLDLIKGEQQ